MNELEQRHMGFGEVTRTQKEERFWLITSIATLLGSLGIVAFFLIVIGEPFEKRHRNDYIGDQIWLAYIAVTLFLTSILGVLKYMRFDEKDATNFKNKAVMSVMQLLEVNMWIAILTFIVIVAGFIITIIIY